MFAEAKGIVEALRAMLGGERVLDSPEDIYVYSRVGGFGVRRLPSVVAVVRRIRSGFDGGILETLERLGVRVIDNQRLGEMQSSPDSPSVIFDCREPVGIEGLAEGLRGVREAESEAREALRDASSIYQRAASSLRYIDGYRIARDRMSDSGFCVVQGFFDGVETYSSKGRLALSRGLFRGELEATPRLVDSIYSCTACGQCYDELSEGTLEIDNAIIRARCEVVNRGMGPSQGAMAARSIAEYGNPLGMPPEDRVLWYEELAEERSFEGNSVLYWSGCSTSYRLPEIVESTAHVLEEAGVDFGVLGENEGCCGLIMYLMGHWGEAERNAMHIAGMMARSGADTLVTNCAGCYYAFTRVYPSLGVSIPLPILHTSQFMDELIAVGHITPGTLEGRYTWHDPCDLGRHCHVYQPPRRVLGSIPGLSLVEHELSREHAVCCGVGGGVWVHRPDLSEHVTRQKLSDAVPRDVDGIVTGCPACILGLRDAAGRVNPLLKVRDLSEIVDESLG